MKDFRDLKVWRKSHELTLSLYRVSSAFPADERYGLSSQLRRSSASIPANIAEGCGRGGDRDFGRFLQMALGSASEVEYHLLLAHDLNLLNKEVYENLAGETSEIKRMLTGLIQKLRTDSQRLAAVPDKPTAES